MRTYQEENVQRIRRLRSPRENIQKLTENRESHFGGLTVLGPEPGEGPGPLVHPGADHKLGLFDSQIWLMLLVLLVLRSEQNVEISF